MVARAGECGYGGSPCHTAHGIQHPSVIYYPLSAILELRFQVVWQVPAGVCDDCFPGRGIDDDVRYYSGVCRPGAVESRSVRPCVRGTPGLPGVNLSDVVKVETIASQYPDLLQPLASLEVP